MKGQIIYFISVPKTSSLSKFVGRAFVHSKASHGETFYSLSILRGRGETFPGVRSGHQSPLTRTLATSYKHDSIATKQRPIRYTPRSPYYKPASAYVRATWWFSSISLFYY